jgi:nucleoside-diphosphate-sugar epimerase
LKANVLLTGATGLVGADILRSLIGGGYMVCAIARKPPETDSTSVQWIKADLATDPVGMLRTVPKVDFVVHAAAALRGTDPATELATLRKTNMEFSEALFQWAAHNDLTGVIYISSFSVLRRPLEDVIDEDHPLGPLTCYALTKHWGELALIRHASTRYRPIALRISSPIAFSYERLQETVVKKWIRLARARQTLTVHGSGARTQDFVSTEDIAQAVVGAIKSTKASGVYHIGSGTPLPMRELAELIAGHWKSSIEFQGEDANENERWNIAIAKAERELGYAPRYSARGVIEKLLSVLT